MSSYGTLAKLAKRALYQRVESGFRVGGARFLLLPPERDFPARYRLLSDGSAVTARIYIWNITHGGGAARAASEFRIQITSGVSQFEGEPGGKTVILGWWDEESVFAGFDFRRHTEPLGASPSIQVGEAALRSASIDGMAVHNRGTGELVICFRPEFMSAYIGHITELHSAGVSAIEIALLGQIATDPATVPDEQIAAEVAEPRRQAIATVRRMLRDIRFRSRILAAYNRQCAICGVQLRLLDAAHILPVEHPGSVDSTTNGVALCALHHRAYDRALVAFDETYRVHINEEAVAAMQISGEAGGIAAFRAALRHEIILPAAMADRPKEDFVRAGNKFRGWAPI